MNLMRSILGRTEIDIHCIEVKQDQRENREILDKVN